MHGLSIFRWFHRCGSSFHHWSRSNGHCLNTFYPMQCQRIPKCVWRTPVEVFFLYLLRNSFCRDQVYDDRYPAPLLYKVRWSSRLRHTNIGAPLLHTSQRRKWCLRRGNRLRCVSEMPFGYLWMGNCCWCLPDTGQLLSKLVGFNMIRSDTMCGCCALADVASGTQLLQLCPVISWGLAGLVFGSQAFRWQSVRSTILCGYLELGTKSRVLHAAHHCWITTMGFQWVPSVTMPRCSTSVLDTTGFKHFEAQHKSEHWEILTLDADSPVSKLWQVRPLYRCTGLVFATFYNFSISTCSATRSRHLLQIEFSGMIKYSARQTMMEAMKQCPVWSAETSRDHQYIQRQVHADGAHRTWPRWSQGQGVQCMFEALDCIGCCELVVGPCWCETGLHVQTAAARPHYHAGCDWMNPNGTLVDRRLLQGRTGPPPWSKSRVTRRWTAQVVSFIQMALWTSGS